jgi:hypothetical protein
LNLTPHSTVNTLWTRPTTLILLAVGAVLSVISFMLVMSMPDLSWHGARHDELQATYETYQETGTPLIKHIGTGSYYTQAPGPGELTFAAWDDDPGSYLVASLMGAVTQSDSPYPGLKLVMATLVALPLFWLPLAVARIFRRPLAGYALVLLPIVMWLLNGTFLVGTEYGLSDSVSTLPVYALYGIAASMAFLSLSLVLWASTYRLGTAMLIGVSVGIAVLAGFGNLARSLSGVGVAAAIGVLWWLNSTGRLRWLKALAASAVAVALALGLQNGIMSLINAERVEATGHSLGELPDAHGTWHPLYLGLAYPQPITGQPSPFGVVWDDAWGWEQAREIDPDVVIGGEEYDLIVKDLYLDEVFSDPLLAAKLYVKKALYVLQQFGGVVAFIVVGFALVLVRRTRQRRAAGAALVLTAPTLLLALVPPVLVMPMLYYYSELSAALGILAAVALGAIVWSLTPKTAADSLEEVPAVDAPAPNDASQETASQDAAPQGAPSQEVAPEDAAREEVESRGVGAESRQ